MRSGPTRAASTSTNWSGLVQEGTNIEGAEAYWTVPSVQPSGSSLYSSTWVGVDGASNSDLIQTGTEQDTSDGYYAWWEILPAASVEITDTDGNPAVVEPGDQMLGSVAEASPGTWTIYLDDITEGWYFEQNYSYGGPGTSAEWIEEAPTIGGSQSSPADFGSVEFTQTGIFGDFGSSGTTWYGTAMSAANEVDMVNSAGTRILAAASAPTTDPSGGQDFAVTYEDVPETAPTVRVTSPTDDYQLSANIRITYSASDASSPVADYDIRYYVFPWNSASPSGYHYPAQWQGTTSRGVLLSGGIPGDEYCFEVRATSVAGATSPWSQAWCANLPIGEASLHALVAGAWTRHHASGYYLDSYAESAIDGSVLRLSGADANQVAVVATRCPSCGELEVFINGRAIGSIDTHGSQVQRGVIFVLPAFHNGRVTVELEDLSKSAKVIIEGLGIG